MSAPARLDPTVYLVTDTRLCGGPAGVVETVRGAVSGGVTAVQLRDPGASTRELVALGEALLALLRPVGVPLVVDDRVDVALALGADGAHVGQSDLDPVAARRLLGPGRHLGLSVSTPDEARAAVALPPGTVDLLGVGPVNPTTSKADARPAVGADGLARVVHAASAGRLPCVAIGGLRTQDVPALHAAGAAGSAVVSAVCGTPDPEAATRSLVRAWAEARSATRAGSAR
ncbi:thiamine phosphate synthase [Xylanimonas oleitrophica]|uniref:Thiamine-phosphate synthase n=1 Tax=Xylanimonas oleitrophica TaxID=2607479 RepID=A0A2W5WV86_9MICO|nr:thiamine phosphate synthase [Xylanimonas oleitrophica]PZR55379.1 thiamine phosphate synthase [Xylanimonas oleitrophica]